MSKNRKKKRTPQPGTGQASRILASSVDGIENAFDQEDALSDEPAKQPEYLWCLHCEHVYSAQAWRSNHNECPDCGAPRLGDGWDWTIIAEANGYPAIPEEGKYYAQYPPAGSSRI
jgi:hypothetical protein